MIHSRDTDIDIPAVEFAKVADEIQKEQQK
jgi:hypothetical protein